MKAKQFIKKLRAAGVRIEESEGGSSHYMAYCNGKKVPVMHHSADLGNVYCKMVCKQLGLDPKEVM